MARSRTPVDGAADGDTIQIRKGRFVEHVIISHKSHRLRGAGPFLTVVDGDGTGRAFSITGDFRVTHVSLSRLSPICHGRMVVERLRHRRLGDGSQSPSSDRHPKPADD